MWTHVPARVTRTPDGPGRSGQLLGHRGLHRTALGDGGVHLFVVEHDGRVRVEEEPGAGRVDDLVTFLWLGREAEGQRTFHGVARDTQAGSFGHLARRGKIPVE